MKKLLLLLCITAPINAMEQLKKNSPSRKSANQTVSIDDLITIKNMFTSKIEWTDNEEEKLTIVKKNPLKHILSKIYLLSFEKEKFDEFFLKKATNKDYLLLKKISNAIEKEKKCTIKSFKKKSNHWPECVKGVAKQYVTEEQSGCYLS